MARGIDNAQTGDDLVPRLDRFDLIFDCSVVAPRARDEAGAFRRQAARCVCACPEIPFCGRDVELALSMPAALKLFQSFPAVGIKRSPEAEAAKAGRACAAKPAAVAARNLRRLNVDIDGQMPWHGLLRQSYGARHSRGGALLHTPN